MNRDYVTIVSGLPRSGTSLMMRMIGEGGIPILSDGLRVPDEDNPNGYYEFERVRRTRQDPSWIPDALGKVVKMVHLLLLELPLTHEYRVVFMRRDLREVIKSQNRMLPRLNKPADDLPDERVAEIYKRQIETTLTYLQSHDDYFRVIEVDYNVLIKNPLDLVRRVGAFFDGLNTDEMVKAIDVRLYRNQIAD